MSIFAALTACWPAAESWSVGSWTIRRGEGGGSRASAASLDGPLSDPGPAEAAMRSIGQRPLFMVRAGEDSLEAVLVARGYELPDTVTILSSPAAGLRTEAPDWSMVRCEAPLARMVEIWDDAGIGAARRAVMARVAGPKIWLLARDGDRPAGCAFVDLFGTTAMMHALVVAPFARRKGLGCRLVRAAATWASAQGAEDLALAVSRSNEVALAMYGGLGMREVAGYHYRAAPMD